MNLGIQRNKSLVAGFLLLCSTFASYGALADVNDRSAGAVGQNVPVNQEAEGDSRFLAVFRAAPLTVTRAIAIAEGFHTSSRTAAITFDISGTPVYRTRTVRNKEIWENVIDAFTGQAIGHEVVLSLNELDPEERDNIIALRSVEQKLSDAVAIAEKTGAGKAISGGLVKESDQVNFVVIVLSDDRVKEVFLEPPRPLSKTRPPPARRN